MSKTIIGLLTIILSQFVPMEELQTVLEAVGILLAWYGRYAHGDISLMGIKKDV